jgi:hypothetical protein
MKPGELRQWQRSYDVPFMHAYFPGTYSRYSYLMPQIKEIDSRALWAEAIVIGPPGFGKEYEAGDLPRLQELLRSPGPWNVEDIDYLRQGLRMGVFSRTDLLAYNEKAENVLWFVSTYNDLLNEVLRTQGLP